METQHTSLQLRIGPTVAAEVTRWSGLLGWPPSKTATHFITELLSLVSGARKPEQVRNLLEAQCALAATLHLNRACDRRMRAKLKKEKAHATRPPV